MSNVDPAQVRRLGIVDLGVGSTGSIASCLRRTCAQLSGCWQVSMVSEPDALASCDRIVLSPAGPYAACAQALAGAMGHAIRRHIGQGKGCLASSVGMALLFERSDEAPGLQGLGVLRGRSRGLVATPEAMSGLIARVPHIGWNRLTHSVSGHPIVGAAGRSGTWMYFAHDEHVVPEDRSVVLATVEHGAETLVAAVGQGSVVGTQFRPELSHRAGIRVLVAFLQ